MLGTVTSNEAQALETLGKIKAAGYDGLELNRFMIHPSSLIVRYYVRVDAFNENGITEGNCIKLS